MDPIELNLSSQEKADNVKQLLEALNIRRDRLEQLEQVFRQEVEEGNHFVFGVVVGGGWGCIARR